MPSIKSRLIALFLKHSRKKAFTSADELNRWIAAARQTQNHRPPAQLFSRLDIVENRTADFPVFRVRPKGGVGDMRVLYLHGGAYVFEITSYHWHLVAEMAQRLGAEIVVPIYPIAPEHDFHDMFGMVLEVYRELLGQAPAEDIVFMGDSAGGNMAVVLTMLATGGGLPSPARHVLISPGLDMSLANPAVFEAEKQDPWLAIPGGLEAIRLYGAGIDRADWRISPIYGDLSVLSEMLILTGSRDLLTPDNIRFAEKARASGVDVELVVEDGMFHVWPLIDMPEARQARDRIVAFLNAKKPTDHRVPPASNAVSDMRSSNWNSPVP
jgi:acetyl esterase/lipase